MSANCSLCAKSRVFFRPPPPLNNKLLMSIVVTVNIVLTDERWGQLNRGKHLHERSTTEPEEQEVEMTSVYEEEENVIPEEEKPVFPTKLPQLHHSKIPRLQKETTSSSKPSPRSDMKERLVNMGDHEVDSSVRSSDTKITERQNNKLLRKMAEMKFSEEYEYIQKKVQKAMVMVHFKGREERVREIEEELREKFKEEPEMEEKEPNKEMMEKSSMLVAHENDGSGKENDVGQLKQHIDREMAIQRQEIASLRKNIKADISEAMERSRSRYEELWDFVIKMNAWKQSNGRHLGRSRPHSDDVYFNKPSLSGKRMKKHRMANRAYGRESADEAGYSDYR